ncbi:MAG: c-type cytochrome, partial [Limisphaerales bacterium]
TDVLKAIVLDSIVKNLGPEDKRRQMEELHYLIQWSPELQKAFQTLLASKNFAVQAAALPLISRWDKNGAMASDLKTLVQQLIAKLNDANQPDEQGAQMVSSLMSVRRLNPEILPSVAKILGSSSSAELQKKVIESLGETGDADLSKFYTDAYATLPAELQSVIFEQMTKRPDWSLALVEAVKGGKIKLAALSPNAVHRLRTHSDKSVSQRANEVIDEIRGPETKEKNALIAKFTPLVTQSGNMENGHKLFTLNCAVCHKFNGEGKEVAPDLTGMGAHGAAELIVHILDPNRVVEPNFVAYSVETKDGETYDGIVVTDTKKRVVLRNAAGDKEILRTDIKERKKTGRSLMPEGFEALGGESLRDILSYICAGDSKYRILDLAPAFTADSTQGIYSTRESTSESLLFKKFGLIKVGEIPFEIVNPLKTRNGNNLVVLKGGEGFAKTLPQRVEIPNVNLKASRLHFLGGVGAWAWPWGGENKNKGLPVAKITIQYADNKTEEIILKNGVEIADYNGAADVPGSTAAPEIVERGQVRWFTKTMTQKVAIQKIILESFDNSVAPTFVGITAETID